MSFKGYMVKQTVVRLCHQILLSSNKEQTIDTNNNLDESLVRYAEWKRPRVSGNQSLGSGERRVQGRNGYGYKRTAQGPLWMMNLFVSRLWWWLHEPTCVTKFYRHTRVQLKVGKYEKDRGLHQVILVVMLYCNSANFSTGENWVKGHAIFLYYFSQLHMNLYLSHNKEVSFKKGNCAGARRYKEVTHVLAFKEFIMETQG